MMSRVYLTVGMTVAAAARRDPQPTWPEVIALLAAAFESAAYHGKFDAPRFIATCEGKPSSCHEGAPS